MNRLLINILALLVLLPSAPAYANAGDMARIHELNPIIDREEIIEIANKVKQETDTRKVFGPDSPEFLETYGHLLVDGALRCTGNLVVHDEKASSEIVTTAAHCFHDDEAQNAAISIQFTKRDGTVIQRNLTPYVINNEYDYAIMKLDLAIDNSLIKPLLIADYNYEEIMDTDYGTTNPYQITFAGYSVDEYKGDGGRRLTYDQDCKMINNRTNFLVDSNCVAYPGASGGAFVITVTDLDNNNKVTDYFVGVNNSVSIDPTAKEKTQVATFTEHSAMYEDLLNALGEELPLVEDNPNNEESSVNQ